MVFQFDLPSRYRLNQSQVPAHISHGLAEKIFFIGESIQLFESDRRVEVL